MYSLSNSTGFSSGGVRVAIIESTPSWILKGSSPIDLWKPFTGLIVLGVTVLTSMDGQDLETIGMRGTVEDAVVRLATLALSNGCQGIVTSAREASRMRADLGHDFALVTPGVRPAGSSVGDQVRVVTPAEAIAAGASHIVVGRPITEAADPAAEARAILAQISV